MILGKPKNIDNFISVSSAQSEILHEMGFVPLYREIDKDLIYYYKDENIKKVVEEKWSLITK